MNFCPTSLTAVVGIMIAEPANLWAMAPRQHSVRGVVEAVDCTNRRLSLKSKEGTGSQTFVWTNTTRFLHPGGGASCGLHSGQTIHVLYRREVGQKVLREVRTNEVLAGCGPACK